MMYSKYIIFALVLGLFGGGVGRSLGNPNPRDQLEKEKCLQAPESVLINCQVLNTTSWECLESNVISIPITQVGNDSIVINCTAPYPINVRVSGFQLKDTYKTKFVRNAEQVFNEATFVYSIGIPVDNFTAPRRIFVTKFNDPTNQMSFFMFRPGNELMHTSTNSISSAPVTIEKNPGKMTIPCTSADPYRPPRLQRRNQQGSNSSIIPTPSNDAVVYDRTQGFILNTDIFTNTVGLYDCLDNSSTSEKSTPKALVFEIIHRKNLVVQPNVKHIVLFKNDELNLLCRNHRKIQLVGTFRGGSIKSPTTVDVDFTSTFIQRKVKVGDEGQIDCVDEDSKAILHSWSIETLDIYNNSQLQLEKLDSNEVACQSSSADAKLQTVYCQGVSNCELNKGCFEQGSKCPSLREGHKCSSSSSGSGSCLNFTTEDGYFSQGMIRCSAKNYSYTTTYFRGFDGVLYLDWETAPLDALVEVRVPTNITMYPQNSYPFGCRASRFISDGTIQWVIRGKDGSEILLHKKRVQDLTPPIYNLNYDLYTVRESDIRLIYPNDYDILCLVPMWNATASLRNHKRINVAAKTAPVKEILIGSGVLITLLIIPLVYVIWRLKKAKEAIRNLTEQEVEEFVKGNPIALQQDPQGKNAHEVVDAIPYNRDFEIPRNKLLIDSENILGEGAFGTVLKGKVEGMSEVVAVKTVKPRCDVNQFKGFLSELKIMMYIGKHPYVVGLIGAHTDKIREKVIYIVVEYCAHGSLEHILRSRKGSFVDQIQGDQINVDVARSVETMYQNVSQSNSNINTTYVNQNRITTVDLVRWSYEIATGMDYLTSKKVVHADLAARNVLIHENGTAKITDFGLSRQLFNYTQYVKKQQEPLPWRWMAIESLRNLAFSTQSDVWSYGVTLWEIFSLGDVPYPGLAWTISFVEQLTSGLRMVKPPHATRGIYEIMLNCWQENSALRPSFKVLSDCFRIMLETVNMEIKDPKVSSAEKTKGTQNSTIVIVPTVNGIQNEYENY